MGKVRDDGAFAVVGVSQIRLEWQLHEDFQGEHE